jgi:hypothetical protein
MNCSFFQMSLSRPPRCTFARHNYCTVKFYGTTYRLSYSTMSHRKYECAVVFYNFIVFIYFIFFYRHPILFIYIHKNHAFVSATFLTTKNGSMGIDVNPTTITTSIPYIVKTPFQTMPITPTDILSTTTVPENPLSTLRGMDDYYYYYCCYNNLKRLV